MDESEVNNIKIISQGLYMDQFKSSLYEYDEEVENNRFNIDN
jgi:hypothetical protein